MYAHVCVCQVAVEYSTYMQYYSAPRVTSLYIRLYYHMCMYVRIHMQLV